jgi:DNA repair exonuclease SbcCD ATPase subunit
MDRGSLSCLCFRSELSFSHKIFECYSLASAHDSYDMMHAIQNASKARLRQTVALVESRERQARQLRKKMEDEQNEFREAQRLLAVEQSNTESKQAALQQEMNAVRHQNEARIAAKLAALEQEKEEDRALMEETMQTLAKQEAGRVLALKQFHVGLLLPLLHGIMLEDLDGLTWSRHGFVAVFHS